jgi:excisionase family DNA binding protein
MLKRLEGPEKCGIYLYEERWGNMTTTTRQVAKQSGLTHRRIRQLCASGEIRAFKLGRDWLIRDEEAERFLQERQRKDKD